MVGNRMPVTEAFFFFFFWGGETSRSLAVLQGLPAAPPSQQAAYGQRSSSLISYETRRPHPRSLGKRKIRSPEESAGVRVASRLHQRRVDLAIARRQCSSQCGPPYRPPPPPLSVILYPRALKPFQGSAGCPLTLLGACWAGREPKTRAGWRGGSSREQDRRHE